MSGAAVLSSTTTIDNNNNTTTTMDDDNHHHQMSIDMNVTSLTKKQQKNHLKTVAVIVLSIAGMLYVSSMVKMSGTDSSNHTNNNNNMVASEIEAHKYNAKVYTDQRIYGQLAQELKATETLAVQNKARLDALTGQVNGDKTKIEAKINVIKNRVNKLNNDVDIFVLAPDVPGDARIPYLMPEYVLPSPRVIKKSQKVGEFNYHGNTRFVIDCEFQLHQLVVGGPTRSVFMVGDGFNHRLPAMFLWGPKGNKPIFYMRTSDSVHTKLDFGERPWVAGAIYKVRVESTGTVLTAKIVGPNLDVTMTRSHAKFKVLMMPQKQGVWLGGTQWEPAKLTMRKFAVMQMY